MADNKPCQHCVKYNAQKRLIVSVHVKDISSGQYGDSLAGVEYKFELCDMCAAEYMDQESERARNFALDLTQHGKARRVIPAETGLSRMRHPVDPNEVIVDAEVVA